MDVLLQGRASDRTAPSQTRPPGTERLPVKAIVQEIQRVIDAFVAHGLTFQAQHQHLYDLRRMVWFVRSARSGDPIRLATPS